MGQFAKHDCGGVKMMWHMRNHWLALIKDKIFVISLYTVSVLSRYNLTAYTVTLSSSVFFFWGRNATCLTTSLPVRAGPFWRLQPRWEHEIILFHWHHNIWNNRFRVGFRWYVLDKGNKRSTNINNVEHAIFFGEMGKTVSNFSSSQMLLQYLFISSTLNFHTVRFEICLGVKILFKNIL